MCRQTFLTRLHGLCGRINAKKSILILKNGSLPAAFGMLTVNSGLQKGMNRSCVLQKGWQNFWGCLTWWIPLSILRCCSQRRKLLHKKFKKAASSRAVLSELSGKSLTQFFPVSLQLYLLRMSAKVAFLIDFSELFFCLVSCVWAESWGVLGSVW